jgi:hypothetical protein
VSPPRDPDADPAEATVEHAGGRYDGPQRNAPYPLSRLSAPHDLVHAAQEIEAADAALASVVGAKLETIAEQVRTLRAQAQRVLDDARRDAELHRAECRMKKKPGAIYHLYRRESGMSYLSLLSPDDWKGIPPHPHEGSFRLEADMRWTRV